MGKRITIEKLQEIARSHGGKCLSKEYKNKKTNMLWECKEGHQFERVADPILYRGRFCPICASNESGKNKRLSKKELNILCQEKQITLLSNFYTSIYDKLEWQCQKNHIFQASTAEIKSRKFPCPECRTLALT
ncbi:MAG: hypothetical protein GY756_25510 [bacterium]|nr:hypothetical protein [bacterium]